MAECKWGDIVVINNSFVYRQDVKDLRSTVSLRQIEGQKLGLTDVLVTEAGEQI